MPRVQQTSLWRSDIRIVFSVLNIMRTELVNSTEATQQEIVTLSSQTGSNTGKFETGVSMYSTLAPLLTDLLLLTCYLIFTAPAGR